MLSVMEHHANIVPWHFLRERQGVVLKWVDVDADGGLGPAGRDRRDRSQDQAGCSNAVFERVGHSGRRQSDHRRRACTKGVPVLVDGSQGAVHMPVNVAGYRLRLSMQLLATSFMDPSGSGAIYIKSERMAEMRPFIGGGDMIKEVSKDQVIYNDPPMKFEAGTPGYCPNHRSGCCAGLHDGSGDGKYRRSRIRPA